MRILTRFEIGQEVYTLHEDEYVKTSVVKIEVTIQEDWTYEVYELLNIDKRFNVGEIFETPEELLDAKPVRIKSLI